MQSRFPFRGALIAATMLFSSACASDGVTTPNIRVDDDGMVRFVNLEGGFYAIETSAGRHLDPVNLPVEFRQNGLAVHVSGSVLTDRVGIHMSGEIFEISAIARRQ